MPALPVGQTGYGASFEGGLFPRPHNPHTRTPPRVGCVRAVCPHSGAHTMCEDKMIVFSVTYVVTAQAAQGMFEGCAVLMNRRSCAARRATYR